MKRFAILLTVLAALAACIGAITLNFPSDSYPHTSLSHHPPVPNANSNDPPATLQDDPNRPREVRENPFRAGAVLLGAGFDVVRAAVQIPILHFAPGANQTKQHALSAWIGLDGESTCPHTFLRVGVDMFLSKTGPAYLPWFGWYPNNVHHITFLDPQPGDWLDLSIHATNLTFAWLSITNRRTNVTGQATAENHPTLMCGFNALWMVQDLWSSQGVPLPNFGTMLFSEVQAQTVMRVARGVEDAYLEAVRERDGQLAVTCEKLGEEMLWFKYQGGHP